MFYDQLLHADPGAFDAAASAFTGFGEDVRDRASDYNQQVLLYLNDDGTWRGKAASAARRPSGDLQLALNRAAEQVEAVPGILRDHADRLSELKGRLKGIVGNASDAGIQVRASGAEVTVTAPAELKEQSSKANWPDPEKAVLEDIKGVLQQATELDMSTADKLRETLTAESLDAHQVGADYRDAVKDAKRAAHLLKLLGEDFAKHGVDDDALRKELNKLLAEHADDPEFAKVLYGTLGGKGTVRAFADIAALGHGRDVSDIQKHLGELLAIGTDPKSAFPLGDKWVEDLKDAGRSQIHLPATAAYSPYGHQLIGTYLHAGDYSSEFLNDIGADMLTFERENPGVFERNVNPGGLYSEYGFKLNHIDGRGAGYDPFNGLMMAMERNPDAAEQFFREGTDRVEYMLDRGNWSDVPAGHEGGADRDGGQALVIDAISNVTDGATGGPAFKIFEETIAHVGSTDPDTGGLNNNASRDSMSKLLQGQLPEVNKNFYSDEQRLGGLRTELDRVLGDVARSPEAYASLNNAERAYTAMRMEEIVSDKSLTNTEKLELMKRAAENGAGMMAQLDEGRRAAIDDHWQGKEDLYNRRVEDYGGLGGYALGKAVDYLPGGDLMKDLANAVGSEVLGSTIDSAKVDYAADAEGEKAELAYDSQKHMIRVAEQMIWEHKLYESEIDPPKSLFRDGQPIPISDMTDAQRELYYDWKNDKNAGYSATARDALTDIDNAYARSSINAEHSQGGS